MEKSDSSVEIVSSDTSKDRNIGLSFLSLFLVMATITLLLLLLNQSQKRERSVNRTFTILDHWGKTTPQVDEAKIRNMNEEIELDEDWAW